VACLGATRCLNSISSATGCPMSSRYRPAFGFWRQLGQLAPPPVCEKRCNSFRYKLSDAGMRRIPGSREGNWQVQLASVAGGCEVGRRGLAAKKNTAWGDQMPSPAPRGSVSEFGPTTLVLWYREQRPRSSRCHLGLGFGFLHPSTGRAPLASRIRHLRPCFSPRAPNVLRNYLTAHPGPNSRRCETLL
jgi:hypothetical protein